MARAIRVHHASARCRSGQPPQRVLHPAHGHGRRRADHGGDARRGPGGAGRCDRAIRQRARREALRHGHRLSTRVPPRRRARLAGRRPGAVATVSCAARRPSARGDAVAGADGARRPDGEHAARFHHQLSRCAARSPVPAAWRGAARQDPRPRPRILRRQRGRPGLALAHAASVRVMAASGAERSRTPAIARTRPALPRACGRARRLQPAGRQGRPGRTRRRAPVRWSHRTPSSGWHVPCAAPPGRLPCRGGAREDRWSGRSRGLFDVLVRPDRIS